MINKPNSLTTKKQLLFQYDRNKTNEHKIQPPKQMIEIVGGFKNKAWKRNVVSIAKKRAYFPRKEATE